MEVNLPLTKVFLLQAMARFEDIATHDVTMSDSHAEQ